MQTQYFILYQTRSIQFIFQHSMLKIPLRQINLELQSEALPTNLQKPPQTFGKLKRYLKSFKSSLTSVISAQEQDFKPADARQTYSASFRHHLRRRTEFQSFQPMETISQQLLKPYFSKRKSRREDMQLPKASKSLKTVMIAFGTTFSDSKKKEKDTKTKEKDTKMKEKEQALARWENAKKSKLSLSIFSERQNRIGQRSYYYAGERHRLIQLKLRNENQRRLKSQKRQALVIQKYKSKGIKSESPKKASYPPMPI